MVAQRDAAENPDDLAGCFQMNPFCSVHRQREGAEINCPLLSGIIADGNRNGILGENRSGPVQNIFVVKHFSFCFFPISVFKDERTGDTGAGRDPATGMQQMEKPCSLLRFRNLENNFPKSGRCKRAVKHNHRLAVVALRINQIELDAAELLTGGVKFPEILFGALVGPAALFVSRGFIGIVPVGKFVQ